MADGLEEQARITLELFGQFVGGFQILVDHHHHLETLGGLWIHELVQALGQDARIGRARQVLQAQDDLGGGTDARFGLAVASLLLAATSSGGAPRPPKGLSPTPGLR